MNLRKIFVFSLLMMLAGAAAFASTIAAAPNGGIWSSFGLSYYGAPSLAPAFDAISITAIPGRNGVWAVNSDGTVYAAGDAPVLCGTSNGQNLSQCTQFNTKNGNRELTFGT